MTSNAYATILRLVCLALVLVIAWQVRGLSSSEEETDSLQVDQLKALLTDEGMETPPAASDPDAPRNDKTARTDGKESTSLPKKYDIIADSGVFGKRPTRVLPLSLVGILGKQAILQTPTGPRDLLREGDELGGVKLLRVGTNRVLVEHEGKTKELTLFSGIGGESLLPLDDKMTDGAAPPKDEALTEKHRKGTAEREDKTP